MLSETETSETKNTGQMRIQVDQTWIVSADNIPTNVHAAVKSLEVDKLISKLKHLQLAYFDATSINSTSNQIKIEIGKMRLR